MLSLLALDPVGGIGMTVTTGGPMPTMLPALTLIDKLDSIPLSGMMYSLTYIISVC